MTDVCVRCERIIDDGKTMCLDCFEWALYQVEINSVHYKKQRLPDTTGKIREG